jgi:SHO1 osmosensor
MPPRGSGGLDFTPILTHYLFLFTSVLAIVRISSNAHDQDVQPFVNRLHGFSLSFLRLSSKPVRPPHEYASIHSNAAPSLTDGSAGDLWFAIFLELFLILGVLYTLATDAVSMHRFQISVFGAVAIVFSVNGVQFNGFGAATKAMSAGWLILAIVNILWVLYFTSEEDSLAFHILNSMGNGGLTPPSRRRRTRTQSSMHNMAGGNGYAGYGSGGGIGSQDVAYDAKVGEYGSGGTALRSQNSFAGSTDAANRSIGAGAGAGGAASINNALGTNAGSISGPGPDPGPHSPLMAGIGAGGSQGANSAVDPTPPADTFSYKARALYACTCPVFESFDRQCH